jgi:hypothetical protein
MVIFFGKINNILLFNFVKLPKQFFTQKLIYFDVINQNILPSITQWIPLAKNS